MNKAELNRLLASIDISHIFFSLLSAFELLCSVFLLFYKICMYELRAVRWEG